MNCLRFLLHPIQTRYPSRKHHLLKEWCLFSWNSITVRTLHPCHLIHCPICTCDVLALIIEHTDMLHNAVVNLRSFSLILRTHKSSRIKSPAAPTTRHRSASLRTEITKPHSYCYVLSISFYLHGDKRHILSILQTVACFDIKRIWVCRSFGKSRVKRDIPVFFRAVRQTTNTAVTIVTIVKRAHEHTAIPLRCFEHHEGFLRTWTFNKWRWCWIGVHRLRSYISHW